jgi:cytochrome c
MQYLPFKRIIALSLLSLCLTVSYAQESPYGDIGRSPTRAELNAMDISILPDGTGLPRGQGTARQGEPIFQAKCAVCHGANLEGRRDIGVSPLVGYDVKSFLSYNPVITTAWDYIRRAMPRFAEGSLTNDEVYALTAYILYKGDLIGQNEVMNAKTLAKVELPNRYNYVPSDLEDIPDIEARGCRNGHCR